MVLNGDRILWGLIFRRDLTEAEERVLFMLLEVVHHFFLLRGGMDEIVWVSSKDGPFSATFYLSVLSIGEQQGSLLGLIWKWKVPPRISAFGWLTLRGCILTMDNLRSGMLLLLMLVFYASSGGICRSPFY